MNTRQLLSIIAFKLTITSICYSSNFTGDFDTDIQRYFGTGQGSPRSYIDTNNQISMRSYIIANPYPNNYPGDSGSQYNHPRSPNQQYFQPSDGSLDNGVYDVINKTAKTPLHSYNQVIIIDGTLTTPTLNKKGKYVDKQGTEHSMIGSANVRSEDESDINTYYFFGQINDSKDKNSSKDKTNNIPTQTYNSQSE